MAKELKFIDSLGLVLSNQAEQHIQSNLLCEFYEQIEQDDDLMGDRKWASMSDTKEVREAFNTFYKLTPKDDEYLNQFSGGLSPTLTGGRWHSPKLEEWGRQAYG